VKFQELARLWSLPGVGRKKWGKTKNLPIGRLDKALDWSETEGPSYGYS